MVNYNEKDEEVTLAVNSELREEVEQMYESMGIDLDTAFTLFLAQSKKERQLPFTLTVDNPYTVTEDEWNELERRIKKSKDGNGRPVKEFLAEFRESIYD